MRTKQKEHIFEKRHEEVAPGQAVSLLHKPCSKWESPWVAPPQNPKTPKPHEMLSVFDD